MNALEFTSQEQDLLDKFLAEQDPADQQRTQQEWWERYVYWRDSPA